MSTSNKDLENLFIEAIVEKLNNLYTENIDDEDEETLQKLTSLMYSDAEKEDEKKEKLNNNYSNVVSNEIYESLLKEEDVYIRANKLKRARFFKKMLMCGALFTFSFLGDAFGIRSLFTPTDLTKTIGHSAAQVVIDASKSPDIEMCAISKSIKNTTSKEIENLTQIKLDNKDLEQNKTIKADNNNKNQDLKKDVQKPKQKAKTKSIKKIDNGVVTKLDLNIEYALDFVKKLLKNDSAEKREAFDIFYKRFWKNNKYIKSATAVVTIKANEDGTRGEWKTHIEFKAGERSVFPIDVFYDIRSKTDEILDTEKGLEAANKNGTKIKH